MLFELKLGKLIRRLNPYTNGDLFTMRCGADPDPAKLLVLGADLADLGNKITAYAQNPTGPNLAAVNASENTLNTDLDITGIPLRADNDFRQDYMTWVFRGQPYAVKRALRITYLYQLTDPPTAPGAPRTPTGTFATEHVLIGYAGSNG